MPSATTRRQSASDLAATISLHLEELSEATDHARLSETMVKYLEMCARFHSYSPRNVWLIMLAMPTATRVAGYQTWRSMGRYVRKGEKGIPILAPIIRWADREEDAAEEPEEELLGFRVVYVFDVSQTEGDPLPKAPEWKSSEKLPEAMNQLIAYASAMQIKVEVQDLPGSTQGVSYGGTILLAPTAGTKTLIHELAHELLHQREEQPMEQALKELEAEAVAYIVGRHFGLEDLTSPNYLALHGVDSQMFQGHIHRIKMVAAELIHAAKGAQGC